MSDLTEIEKQAEHYADQRGALAAKMEALEDEIRRVTRKHLPGIRHDAALAAASHARLKGMIDGARHLFKRPRSVIMSGIRCGVQKAKGKLEFDDADTVVGLIKKHLPDEAETLIRTTETPNKTTLAEVSAKDLKRIGVKVTNDQDVVLIKPADSNVDKLVDALLKENDELEGSDDS